VSAEAFNNTGVAFVKNPGGPSCTQPKTPEECCRPGDLNWELTFCLEICVYCCMECDVGDLVSTPIILPPPASRPVDGISRDYDVINITDGELGFTTSEYGKFIPIVFGSDKLTGNVIWSSEFSTKQFTSGGTIYNYHTVSFALGICEGEIDAVLRLWLGDQLIFDRTMDTDVNNVAQPGADGFVLGVMADLISPDSPLKNLGDGERLTKITVFNGGETQIPEGVIADIEGYALTPAYRGLAYILFENMVVTAAIPNIYVEVLANSNPIYPRVYGNLPVPQTYFNKLREYLVFHEPSYDRVIVSAYDQSGTGIVPSGAGYAVFDGNKLDHVFDREILVTEDLSSFSYGSTAWFPLSDGNWLIHTNHVSQGEEFVYNPESGMRVSTLGPGGSIFNNSLSTGFGFLETNACGTFYYPVVNVPVDVFYGVHVEGDVGFATIDRNGKLKMVSNAASALPGGGDTCRSIVAIYSDAFVAAHPTFSDGVSTAGAHIYFFNYTGVTPANWYVTRISVTGGGTIYDPLVTQLGQINLNEFNGPEYQHFIEKIMLDTDGCFVLLITCSAKGDWIAKWSPFTGTFVWKTSLTFDLPIIRQACSNQLLFGQNYTIISLGNNIYTIDLATGIWEDKGTLLAQLLPNAFDGQQFYNGFENSITYPAASGSNLLVKVFLDRIARSNVPLADIVTILLARVGILSNEMDVDDLLALSLVGYTVNERKSLRTIFSELGQVFRFDIIESNGKIIYRTRGGVPALTLERDSLADVDEDGWLEQHQERDFIPTRKINLTYRDIDREYTSNVQSVILPKYTSDRFDEDAAVEVDVPVVLNASTAKLLAEILLYSKIVYQSTFDAVAAPKTIVLDASDVVEIPVTDEKTITARVREMSIGEDRQVKLSLAQEDPDIYTDQAALFGVVGRFTDSALENIAPRIDPFFMLIPFRSDAEAAQTANYRVYLTFLNSRIGTPPEGITLTINGESYVVPSVLRFPTWGRVITPPVARTSFFTTDNVSSLRVKLSSQTGPLLESAPSKLDLLNNPQMNLAYLGSELIQFETVVDEGNGVYTLSGLHRGVFGTEFGILGHRGGEAFVLLAGADGALDTLGVIALDVPFGESPLKIYQVFMNTNNPFQPNPISMLPALNMRPWAISSFVGKYVGDDAVMTWQRRTRFDGQWEDDGDFEEVPLNEATETYDLYLHVNPAIFNMADPATYLRKVTVTSPTYTYTAAEQTADSFNRMTTDLFVLINQNGSFTGKDGGAAVIRRVEYKR
jgi:hypothetical protein